MINIYFRAILKKYASLKKFKLLCCVYNFYIKLINLHLIFLKSYLEMRYQASDNFHCVVYGFLQEGATTKET